LQKLGQADDDFDWVRLSFLGLFLIGTSECDDLKVDLRQLGLFKHHFAQTIFLIDNDTRSFSTYDEHKFSIDTFILASATLQLSLTI
jgi:hypothetical protein